MAKICVRGYSFSLKRPTLGRLTPYLFFSRKSFLTLLTISTHIARVTVTVVRHRKFLTTLRTNQIAGFVTASSSKKNYMIISKWATFSHVLHSHQVSLPTGELRLYAREIQGLKLFLDAGY